MHVILDKNKMELQVVCGILEKYEPNDKVKEIHAKTLTLQKKMERFMKKTIEPALEDINKLIAEENSKYMTKDKT